MSGYDETQQVEAKSSIKIATTAKGDAQVTVTVREGIDSGELDRLRALAVSAYQETRRAVT